LPHASPTPSSPDRGWATLPNFITIGRILFTPFIGYWVAQRNFNYALPALFVAGWSDALDGWLARHFNLQSRLGLFLDPIADKLLLFTVYPALSIAGELPWWLTGLVLSRDFLILGYAVFALSRGLAREFKPNLWGKLSTFFQLSLAGWSVLRHVWPVLVPWPIWPVFFAGTVVFTICSGVFYAREAAKRV
jgi:cardiolipin synthase